MADSRSVALDVTYEDDPRVLADAAVDDYADHVVPPTGRISRGSLTMAWYGVASAIFYVYVGYAAAATYGTKSALVGLILTIVVYSAINAVISTEAMRTGLSVAMFSRSMFGLAGAALATLIFAATAIYYFVFEGSIIAVAFEYQFGGNRKMWMALVCIAGLLLVMRGVAQWLDKFNGFLLPFYIGGMIAAVIWAGADHGFTSAWWDLQGVDTAHGLPGWLATFLLYMGVWVLMMFTMDFARLGREADREYHTWVTFGPLFYALAFGFTAFVGVFMATTVPLPTGEFNEGGAAIAIVEQMGILGVLLIFITQARINTANLYLASSNLEAFTARVFRVRLPRTVWAVVAAVICYVLMVWDWVLSHLLEALLYQGVFITAWVTMVLIRVGYNRLTNTRVEVRPWRVPMVDAGGLLAWLIPAVLGIVLLRTLDATSSAYQLVPLFTVGLTAVLYIAVLMLFPKPLVHGGQDPALEVEDAWAARIRCATCDKSYVAVEMDRRMTADQEPTCAGCAQVTSVHGPA